MPLRIDLYTAIRVASDPIVKPETRERVCYGPYLDAEYYAFRAETWVGVNGLDHARRACASPTHVVTIPDGAGLAVEVLEGRPAAWCVQGGGRRFIDADELFRLAREGWRGLDVAEVEPGSVAAELVEVLAEVLDEDPAEVLDAVEGFTLVAGRA